MYLFTLSNFDFIVAWVGPVRTMQSVPLLKTEQKHITTFCSASLSL